MLMSTLAASGLYAGITIMPMLGNSYLPEASRLQPAIIPVQAREGEVPAVGGQGNDQSGFVPFPARRNSRLATPGFPAVGDFVSTVCRRVFEEPLSRFRPALSGTAENST
ncbi:hypothetical protein [Rhizobium mongolense]|uniref:hypothetical protein n=1 Tax=Rhizobium mongolense TaxID=57676 RepID=UPI0034A23A1B